MEISIADVYKHCPLSGPDGCPDGLSCLHLEVRDDQMPAESGQVNDWMQIWEPESVCWKSPESCSCRLALWPSFSAGCLWPPVAPLSCSWSETVSMGVLVRGGRDSHSNKTPECRILDDRHLHSRFCQDWAKPARWAPCWPGAPAAAASVGAKPLCSHAVHLLIQWYKLWWSNHVVIVVLLLLLHTIGSQALLWSPWNPRWLHGSPLQSQCSTGQCRPHQWTPGSWRPHHPHECLRKPELPKETPQLDLTSDSQ